MVRMSYGCVSLSVTSKPTTCLAFSALYHSARTVSCLTTSSLHYFELKVQWNGQKVIKIKETQYHSRNVTMMIFNSLRAVNRLLSCRTCSYITDTPKDFCHVTVLNLILYTKRNSSSLILHCKMLQNRQKIKIQLARSATKSSIAKSLSIVSNRSTKVPANLFSNLIILMREI